MVNIGVGIYKVIASAYSFFEFLQLYSIWKTINKPETIAVGRNSLNKTNIVWIRLIIVHLLLLLGILVSKWDQNDFMAGKKDCWTWLHFLAADEEKGAGYVGKTLGLLRSPSFTWKQLHYIFKPKPLFFLKIQASSAAGLNRARGPTDTRPGSSPCTQPPTKRTTQRSSRPPPLGHALPASRQSLPPPQRAN